MIAPLPSQPPLSLPRRSIFDIRGKTSDVIRHHYDPSIPGKPLFYVVPGGLIAVASLGLIVWTLYRMVIQQSLSAASGKAVLVMLGVMYIAAVFVFCYGYERFETGKAVKMTTWIVLLTVLVVVIIAALLLILSMLLREGGLGGGGGGGRSGRGSGKPSSGPTSTSASSWQQASTTPASTTVYHQTPHYAAPIYLPPVYSPPAYNRPTIADASNSAAATSYGSTQAPAKPVPHQVVCRYCHNVTTITGDAFNCPKCGAPNLPGDLTPASGVGLTAGGMPLTTAAAFKAVLGVSDLRWIGLQPTLDDAEVSVEEGNGVSASWTSDSGAQGGIELDLFNAAGGDAQKVLQTIVSEGDGTPAATQVAESDEAYEGHTDQYAWLAARRGPLVFALSIPSSPRASQQLAYLGGLVLHRVSAG